MPSIRSTMRAFFLPQMPNQVAGLNTVYPVPTRMSSPLGRNSPMQPAPKSGWATVCEAEWIAAEARRLLDESSGLSLGIISFYTAQVEAIKLAMERRELMTRME